MSDVLLSKLSTVRARHRVVVLGTGASLALLAFIVVLAVGMLLDWWLDLPRFVRAAFLAIDLSLVAYILFRRLLMPLIASPDDDAIALRVEDAHPKFASRLIAAVQLSRPQAVGTGASMAFVHATVRQAETIAGEVDFPRVIRTEEVTRFMIAAILAVLIGLTGIFAGRKDHVSTDLLARAFLSNVPVPRKTRIEVTSGEIRMGRGDTATLTATARGVVPLSGAVDIRFNSGRRQTFSIDPTPTDRSSFARPLENVQDSFDYRVKLGDNTSPWFHAEVLTPPVVTQLEVEQVYPAYTKLGTVSRSLGDLSVLSGSRLVLKVTSNNPLQPDTATAETFGNSVHLVNPMTMPSTRLIVDGNNPRQATVEVPMPTKTTGFSIHLRDTNGLASRDPAVYRVDLVSDKAPTVHITYPQRQEELITRIGTIEIRFDAADDFGISKLSLRYKIDEGREQSVPLEIGDQMPRTLHNRYAWKIAKLTPPSATQPTLEGSSIEYWLEVEDNNDVTGPGKGASEHFSAKVVTDAEKRAEILARLAASIQDVQRGVEDEKQLHDTLGNMILEKKTP